MGAVRAVCAPCERGVPLVSGRIALCICGKKGEKSVANVLPIDDVAAVVALHQKPSDLKPREGPTVAANCEYAFLSDTSRGIVALCATKASPLGFVLFAEAVPPNSVVAIELLHRIRRPGWKTRTKSSVGSLGGAPTVATLWQQRASMPPFFLMKLQA